MNVIITHVTRPPRVQTILVHTRVLVMLVLLEMVSTVKVINVFCMQLIILQYKFPYMCLPPPGDYAFTYKFVCPETNNIGSKIIKNITGNIRNYSNNNSFKNVL